jgi:hypothetical protein
MRRNDGSRFCGPLFQSGRIGSYDAPKMDFQFSGLSQTILATRADDLIQEFALLTR